MGIKIPPITRIQEASDTPFDNSINGFTSDEVQSAIEEAKTSASGASRGPAICGFDGTANVGRYLEFYSNNPSNNNPFIVSEPSQIAAISISAASNSTGTVTVYKNGVSLLTIALSAAKKSRTKSLAFGITDLDEVSAKITAGSIDRPLVALFIRTLL